MFDVRVILDRWCALGSVRAVARTTGFNRKTVSRYVRAAMAAGLSRKAPLGDDDVARVIGRVKARPNARRSMAWVLLSARKGDLAELLASRPALPLRRIHAILAERGAPVSYPTLRRFVRRELGWRCAERSRVAGAAPAGRPPRRLVCPHCGLPLGHEGRG